MNQTKTHEIIIITEEELIFNIISKYCMYLISFEKTNF